MAVSASLKARLHTLYLEGTAPYAELVALSGLDRFQFQRLVKDEGWGPRPKPAAAKAETEARAETKAAPAKSKKKKASGGAAKAATSPKRQVAKSVTTKIALLQKIYETLWNELEKLHGQIGSKSQDRERASRALSQLVTTMEKAVTMQSAIKRDANKEKKPKDREALAHADDMRRKIADRLERLHRERMAQK